MRRYPLKLCGVSVSQLALRIVAQFRELRVVGLAAEMTYYALLSLFPLIAAIGASLGFLGRFAGPEVALQAEAASIRALEVVFSSGATASVITPLVQGLLREERTGFALGSFLVSLFFASRVFRSSIDTLDIAYRVQKRRASLARRIMGILFTLTAVLVVMLVLGLVVVGPLLGGGRVIADWLGAGTAFEVIWAVARWPVVFAIATGFLTLLYRAGPNAKNTWPGSLPGAVFGMAGIVVVAVGFRIYLEATGLRSPEIDNAGDAVALAIQVIGALMATLVWLWLSSMVVLTGGLMNAEISRIHQDSPQL